MVRQLTTCDETEQGVRQTDAPVGLADDLKRSRELEPFAC